MQNTYLSTWQFSCMLFLTLLGNAISLAPAGGAGRDAWIAHLLGSLVGLFLIYAMLRIQKAFPGESIVKISEICLGKWVGKIFSLMFILLLFYAVALYLFDLCILLRTIFPFLTDFVLRPLLILTAAYGIYKGTTVVGRLSELAVPVILLFIFASFAIISSAANLNFLQPVLSDWRKLAGGAINAAGWPYARIAVMVFFLPFVTDLKEKSHLIYIWYYIGVIIFLTRAILILAVIGPEYVLLARFPLYAAIRSVALADFQRVELFFTLLWLVSGFIIVLVNYFAIILALKDSLNLPRIRPIILPVGLFLVVISLFMYTSDIEYFPIQSRIASYLYLLGNLFYLTIILAALKLGRQTQHKTGDVSPFYHK